MKKMIAALVLVAAAASPVMAQEYIESGLPNSGTANFDVQAYGSYASTVPQARNMKHHRAHAQMAPEMTYVPQNQSDILDR